MSEINQSIHAEGKHTDIVLKEIIEHSKFGESSGKRPVLLILGGVLRGVYGGGGVCALENLGLRNGFHAVVGVSTGAPTGAYFLSGQSELGTSIYYEECLTSKFINIWRVFFRGRKMVSLEFLSDVWHGKVKNKKLNVEEIRNSKTQLLIAVTEYESGLGDLLKVNNLEDPINPIVASCSIPLLSTTVVRCGDKNYTDGAMSLAFPISEVIQILKPTSILVFPNRSIDYYDNFFVKVWEAVMYYSKDKESAKNFLEKQKNYDKELVYLRSQNIPYTIIWTDNEVQGFTYDAAKLISAKNRYKKFVEDLFEKYL